MADFTLGAILDLPVFSGQYKPFVADNNRTLTMVLSDGTSTGNEVIQGGAVKRETATLGGRTRDSALLAQLKTYYDNAEVIQFVDCFGEDRNVIVWEYASQRFAAGFAEYDLTLIEVL